MSNLVLPDSVRRERMRLATKNYGPRCSSLRVKVYYRRTDTGHRNSTTMSHEEYFKWLEAAPGKKLELVSVEQLRDD